MIIGRNWSPPRVQGARSRRGAARRSVGRSGRPVAGSFGSMGGPRVGSLRGPGGGCGVVASSFRANFRLSEPRFRFHIRARDLR